MVSGGCDRDRLRNVPDPGLDRGGSCFADRVRHDPRWLVTDRLPAGPSVLALVGDMTGPSLWRVLQPVTALERAGYPAGWDRTGNQLVGSIAPSFDGYVLPRTSWPPEQRRMAEAWFASIHRAGKFVVFDADDDVFTHHETARRVDLNWTDGKSVERLEAERFERIWAMQQCDGVTVSTQRLATIVRTMTDRPVIVVANAIDIRWFRKVVRSTLREVPGLTIGWTGGRRSDRDVELMAEAWGRIAARYPASAVNFVVAGWLPAIIRDTIPADRLTVLPWLPLERYPASYRQIDIGCAAVADTSFNAAKSPIKCFEHAAAGAAVVASPLLYGKVIEHGVSGFLATTADEWEAGLSTLIDSPATRSMMAKRLIRKVEKCHSLAVNLHKWPEAWTAIRNNTQARRRRLVIAS
jgi:glycosyltransferase involved in cell wall biosynthesis